LIAWHTTMLLRVNKLLRVTRTCSLSDDSAISEVEE
jgi:hypothetical protein